MTDACLIASNLHGFHSNDFNKPIEQRTSDGVNQKNNILEKGWTSKEFRTEKEYRRNWEDFSRVHAKKKLF